MESKTKSGFSVIQLVEIPDTYLRKGVLKELFGREMYSDTDDDIQEGIYSADVFEQISSEYEELPENSPLRNLDEEDLKQIDALAEELGEYELVRVNKI